jgi:nickel-type superoxide dismutase maturation protease
MTRLTPISRFTINGHSMFPTLKEGEDILSFNWAFIGRKPKVGEIIVLNYKGRDMVKRVIKVDGEEIFVEGDNKLASTDSRDFGAVSKQDIIGKVIYSEASALSECGYGEIPCPRCDSPVIEVYGRKDAICHNCGFKLTCCGEP